MKPSKACLEVCKESDGSEVSISVEIKVFGHNFRSTMNEEKAFSNLK